MSWVFLHTRCLIPWNQFPHKNHHGLNFLLQWKICYQLIFYGNRNAIKFHQKEKKEIKNPFSLVLLVTAGQGYKGWKRTELFVQSRASSPVSSMNNLLIIQRSKSDNEKTFDIYANRSRDFIGSPGGAARLSYAHPVCHHEILLMNH